MSSIGSRLKDERERLGLNQTELAELCGATRKTQFNYETNVRRPDADYLAALATAGADVLYVLTGQYSAGVKPAPAQTPEEKVLLEYFREASAIARRAAMGALIGASAPAGQVMQNLSGGSHNTMIGSVGGAYHPPSASGKTSRRKS